MKKIVILADFSKKTGFGHIKRVSSLIKPLEKKGYKCLFFIDKANYLELKKIISIKHCLVLNSLKKKEILRKLEQLNVKLVIIDSYKKSFLKFKKDLVKKQIKVVAIDDHILNHKAHLVFTNRESPKIKFIKPSYQKWNSGFKFAISSVDNKKFKKIILKMKMEKLEYYFIPGEQKILNLLKNLYFSPLNTLIIEKKWISVFFHYQKKQKYFLNI